VRQAVVIVVVDENASTVDTLKKGLRLESEDGAIASAKGSTYAGFGAELNRDDIEEEEEAVPPFNGPLSNCTSFQADVKPQVLFEEDCMT
jgi:hypothetical protein